MACKKIVVFSVEDFHNLGDYLLGDTVRFLLKNTGNTAECSECYIEKAELLPEKTVKEERPRVDRIYRGCSRLARLKGENNLQYKIENIIRRKRFGYYYKQKLKDADGIIFAVGMYHYMTTLNFSYSFDYIISLAEKKGIPVYLHAMSIALPNKNDWRWQQLVTAVNRTNVKFITTRDGINGYNLLKDFYIKKKFTGIYDYVGDPALWIPECYNIKSIKKRAKVGIGLVRKNVFLTYGSKVSEEDVENFYVKLISLLEEKHVDYEIFSNGQASDYSLGKDVVKKCNVPISKLRRRPSNAAEFIEDVASYQVIFGARLHACLIAHSLGIPFCGLIWESKIRYTADSLGVSDLFIDENTLNPQLAFDNIKKALTYHFDYNLRDKLKQSTFNYIVEFLKCL